MIFFIRLSTILQLLSVIQHEYDDKIDRFIDCLIDDHPGVLVKIPTILAS